MYCLLAATIVAMVTIPTSYSVGSAVAQGKAQDLESAYLRAVYSVRVFVAMHRRELAERGVLEPADIDRLAEIMDECDDIAGYATITCKPRRHSLDLC
jgi:hypothetical protein